MREIILHETGLHPVPEFRVPKELMRVAKNWIESRKPFLLLHGDFGSYKTTLAKHTAVLFFLKKTKNVPWIIENPRNAIWICFFVFHPKLTREFFVENEEVFLRTRLLIIDDFVKEGKCLIELFYVIEERKNAMLRTILTTNLNPEPDLYKDNLIGKIFSRMIDPNFSVVYNCSPFRTRNPHSFKGGRRTW